MTTGTVPIASVIIPARDAEATIGRAVAALLDPFAGRRDGHDRPEVIVVDDGSRDRTAAVARAAGARVIAASGDGPARARNLGAAAARGPLLVFTDADCVATPGFLDALIAPFADASVGGTKGAYVTTQTSWVARFVQQEYEERYTRMANRDEIDFIDSYAAAYRRGVFEAVGGFDERYRVPSTEDQELSFRVAERGARLLFVPAARVEHLHARTPVAYARKKAKIGYYKVATLRRHPGKAIDDAHTPPTLKLQVVLAPLILLGLTRDIAVTATGDSPGLWWSLVPLAPFLASALPLWTRVIRADPAVGLAAPALILLRAVALAVGVTTGLLTEWRSGVLTRASEGGDAPSSRP